LGDARKICRKLVRAKRRFAFVFVDDSHSYDSVLGVCRFLPDLLIAGGFCLFHDYNDIKNIDPNDADYGVPQAVQDGLPNDTFEFYGIFGCCALYRKNFGPSPSLTDFQ
jgi:cephalosporin hydroxylase